MLLLAAALLFLQEADAPRPLVRPLHYRQHFAVGSGGAVSFEFTVISDLTEERFEIVLLVRDPEHGDVLMRTVNAFAEKRSVYRISDVKERTFIESEVAGSPLTSTTISELLREARANPQLFETAPGRVTLRTNGGEWEDFETNPVDREARRRLRHRIRPTIDFFLLEAIERMRGTLFLTTQAAFYFDVIGQYVLYDSVSSEQTVVEAVRQPPDCGFDESFGFACTDEQLKKIRDAAAEGKELVAY
jgi:hypothetical protein